ncbi:MAG TPA: acyltransferase [Candidatus Faecaligallichristensenella faecipullorum]|nr:acyltransferase [Candidatus Faecaligallichristensenella faecipullorum]
MERKTKRNRWGFADCPDVSLKRVDAADALRVIWVGLVACFHVWQFSWLNPVIELGPLRLDFNVWVRTGYIQVDQMLMLSGFLLTLPYLRSRVEKSPWPGWKDFYFKRAVRILPSYWASLLIVLVVYTACGGRYDSPGALLYDLAMHLGFVHNLSYASLVATPLNGVLWTLAVEVQFYLIFPLLIRGFVKKPLLCYVLMTGAAMAYRLGFVARLEDSTLYVNRLPAMLDVYANGMLGCWVYVKIAPKCKKYPGAGLLGLMVGVAALWGIYEILKSQAAIAPGELRRVGQMQRRYLLSLLGALSLVSLSCSTGWARRALSSRPVLFLSGISFNYYIWHQYLAARFVEWGIPPSIYEDPKQAGDLAWQMGYTVLCFGAALAAAWIMTRFLERPAAEWARRMRSRAKETDKKRPARG